MTDISFDFPLYKKKISLLYAMKMCMTERAGLIGLVLVILRVVPGLDFIRGD
jgi:hypothetical protein